MLEPLKYRSIFISDVHLGTLDCQSNLLLDFLESTECESLYLVGDIIDMQKLTKAVYWPKENSELINLVFRKAKRGTCVVYIPGNHDAALRNYVGNHFNGVELKDEDVHVTAQGQRLLVIHGDCLDEVVRSMDWLVHLGDKLYSMIMVMSRYYLYVRRLFGSSYWSFAAFIKYKFKVAVKYIERFESAAARLSLERGFDGIVCGHIHHPNKDDHGEVQYLNTGDWVEHCTALVEDETGQLFLINWLEMKAMLEREKESFPDQRVA